MEILYRPDSVREALPARAKDGHKGDFGRVLVAAGSKNMCGAAYFSAMAAYRMGAGLVYIYTPKCNRVILQQLIPEAVLITYRPGNWREEELKEALLGMDAVVAGPGLGQGEVQKEILKVILSANGLPRILDADALNLLAADETLWELCQAPLVITPHMGEMARLCGRRTADIRADAAGTALQFSKKHRVITVLKDAKTVTSDGTDCYLNTTGNDGMATGGSGDVLSGMIGGLLAQKLPLLEAARLGVYLHGLAGDRAREQVGAYSMTARDILDGIRF